MFNCDGRDGGSRSAVRLIERRVELPAAAQHGERLIDRVRQASPDSLVIPTSCCDTEALLRASRGGAEEDRIPFLLECGYSEDIDEGTLLTHYKSSNALIGHDMLSWYCNGFFPHLIESMLSEGQIGGGTVDRRTLSQNGEAAPRREYPIPTAFTSLTSSSSIGELFPRASGSQSDGVRSGQFFSAPVVHLRWCAIRSSSAPIIDLVAPFLPVVHRPLVTGMMNLTERNRRGVEPHIMPSPVVTSQLAHRDLNFMKGRSIFEEEQNAALNVPRDKLKPYLDVSQEPASIVSQTGLQSLPLHSVSEFRDHITKVIATPSFARNRSDLSFVFWLTRGPSSVDSQPRNSSRRGSRPEVQMEIDDPSSGTSSKKREAPTSAIICLAAEQHHHMFLAAFSSDAAEGARNVQRVLSPADGEGVTFTRLADAIHTTMRLEMASLRDAKRRHAAVGSAERCKPKKPAPFVVVRVPSAQNQDYLGIVDTLAESGRMLSSERSTPMPPSTTPTSPGGSVRSVPHLSHAHFNNKPSAASSFNNQSLSALQDRENVNATVSSRQSGHSTQHADCGTSSERSGILVSPRSTISNTTCCRADAIHPEDYAHMYSARMYDASNRENYEPSQKWRSTTVVSSSSMPESQRSRNNDNNNMDNSNAYTNLQPSEHETERSATGEEQTDSASPLQSVRSSTRRPVHAVASYEESLLSSGSTHSFKPQESESSYSRAHSMASDEHTPSRRHGDHFDGATASAENATPATKHDISHLEDSSESPASTPASSSLFPTPHQAQEDEEKDEERESEAVSDAYHEDRATRPRATTMTHDDGISNLTTVSARTDYGSEQTRSVGRRTHRETNRSHIEQEDADEVHESEERRTAESFAHWEETYRERGAEHADPDSRESRSTHASPGATSSRATQNKEEVLSTNSHAKSFSGQRRQDDVNRHNRSSHVKFRDEEDVESNDPAFRRQLYEELTEMMRTSKGDNISPCRVAYPYSTASTASDAHTPPAYAGDTRPSQSLEKSQQDRPSRPSQLVRESPVHPRYLAAANQLLHRDELRYEAFDEQYRKQQQEKNQQRKEMEGGAEKSEIQDANKVDEEMNSAQQNNLSNVQHVREGAVSKEEEKQRYTRKAHQLHHQHHEDMERLAKEEREIIEHMQERETQARKNLKILQDNARTATEGSRAECDAQESRRQELTDEIEALKKHVQDGLLELLVAGEDADEVEVEEGRSPAALPESMDPVANERELLRQIRNTEREVAELRSTLEELKRSTKKTAEDHHHQEIQAQQFKADIHANATMASRWEKNVVEHRESAARWVIMSEEIRERRYLHSRYYQFLCMWLRYNSSKDDEDYLKRGQPQNAVSKKTKGESRVNSERQILNAAPPQVSSLHDSHLSRNPSRRNTGRIAEATHSAGQNEGVRSPLSSSTTCTADQENFLEADYFDNESASTLSATRRPERKNTQEPTEGLAGLNESAIGDDATLFLPQSTARSDALQQKPVVTAVARLSSDVDAVRQRYQDALQDMRVLRNGWLERTRRVRDDVEQLQQQAAQEVPQTLERILSTLQPTLSQKAPTNPGSFWNHQRSGRATNSSCGKNRTSVPSGSSLPMNTIANIRDAFRQFMRVADEREQMREINEALKQRVIAMQIQANELERARAEREEVESGNRELSSILQELQELDCPAIGISGRGKR